MFWVGIWGKQSAAASRSSDAGAGRGRSPRPSAASARLTYLIYHAREHASVTAITLSSSIGRRGCGNGERMRPGMQLDQGVGEVFPQAAGVLPSYFWHCSRRNIARIMEPESTFPCPTPFTHRPVPGGSTVSFCNQCYETVAISYWEAELDRAEQTHVCDRFTLDHWRELRDEVRFGKTEPEGLGGRKN